MGIKWRKSDEENLNKAVKNFNAKISRLEKKMDKGALPNKIKASEIKSKISDRKDYKRTLDSLKDFSTKKIEIVENSKGEKSTNWEIERTQKLVDEYNKMKKKELKAINEMPIIANGEKINAKRMNERQKLKPITFDFEKASKGHFKDFVKSMEDRIDRNKNGIYKQSFMENLIKGWFNTLSSDKATQLQIIAERLGSEKIYNLYLSGNNEIEPAFIYEPIQNNDKYREIKEILERELEE